jgi:hypothetical protein
MIKEKVTNDKNFGTNPARTYDLITALSSDIISD